MQKTSKLFLIKENVKITKEDVFIGDTGEDMLTGQKLGAKTIGVASGFSNKNVLSEYNPNLIVDNIEEIYKKSILLLK
jgi:phosphoglycolate phosphatase